MSQAVDDHRDRADRTRRVGVALVVAVCFLALVAGWWTKARCLADDGNWTQGEEYVRWCYSDVFPLWFAERLNEGAVPYVDHPVEYPVLTGAQMYVAAQVVELGEEAGRPRAFYDVTSVINVVASLGVLGLLAVAGLHPRRLLWWAAAPTLVVYATLNWDPAAILCMVGAIVLHLRGRDTLAGVAAGIGIAAKFLPGVVIPFIVLARLRQGNVRAAVAHAAAALGAWAVCNVPVALVAPEGWRRFFDLNRQRPADFDSLWFLAERIRGGVFEVSFINTWSAIGVVAGAVAITAVGIRRRDPSAYWELALPVFCWFLITNKVYSPQYSLWLLPLAALALRRLAPFAAFLVADLMVFAIRFPFFAGLTGSLQAPTYDILVVALLLRYGILAWILVESTLDHDPSLLGRRALPAATSTAAKRAAPALAGAARRATRAT